MSDFDTLWKFKALEIAAIEQLEINGEQLQMDSLFERAKMIYNEGYKQRLQNWESIWSGPTESRLVTSTTQKKRPEPVEKDRKIIPEMGPTSAPEGTKLCPKCGEHIPEGWTRHAYKKNKEPCGHVFD